MGYECKDREGKYITTKKPNYKKGEKWCAICQNGFKNMPGLICLCCGCHLRSVGRKPNQTRNKNWQRNKMPTEYEMVQYSKGLITLPQMEAKYPMVANRF